MNMRQLAAMCLWLVVTLQGTSCIARLKTKPNANQVNAQVIAQSKGTQAHLDWAKGETDKAVNEQLAGLDRFFQTAKQGTPQFVDKALGWGSKWNFMLDKVPFIKGGRHQAFLANAFQDNVFTGKQLEQAVKQTVAGYVAKVEAIENQMLVRIRQDMKDMPGAAPPIDKDKLQAAFKQAIAEANQKAGVQVNGEIAKEAVSLMAAEVLTQVTLKMAVSTGILAAGATSSWTTLGVGLVVGVAADQLVTWGWNKLANPKGQLTRHVNAAIDDLQRQLVHGNAKNAGLRQQLERHAAERNDLRRKAIQSLEQKGGSK